MGLDDEDIVASAPTSTQQELGESPERRGS